MALTAVASTNPIRTINARLAEVATDLTQSCECIQAMLSRVEGSPPTANGGVPVPGAHASPPPMESNVSVIEQQMRLLSELIGRLQQVA